MDPSFGSTTSYLVAMLVAGSLALTIGALARTGHHSTPGLDRIERVWFAVPVVLLTALAWATYLATGLHG